MNNKRIYLAPMVGRTDQYYRSFVRILSKNICLYTEMITCDSFLHTDRRNYIVKEEEKNLTIQLAGSDPKKYGLCASIIQEKGYNEINLNIGCPSSKVVKGEFGACLMKDPDKVADCVYEIKKTCSLPISIKTRLGLGYEENLDLLFNLIDKTKDSGCSKYIIHARNAILNGLSPKKNRNIPLLRYADVSVVKNTYPDLEFYLNGGVEDILEIRKNIDKFDGLMIGRKIYDNPMFLNEIEEKIYGNERVLSRKSILKEYLKYALSPENKDTSNYLLLRHLFSLYYNTSSSKKWKKFIHDIIQSDKNIELITNFEELTYDEETKAHI